MTRLAAALRWAWGEHAVLAGVILAFVGALGLFGLGLILDPRRIAGAPAWLKPAKFAASSGIFCATLLWLLTSVDRPAWGMRWAGSVVAWFLVVEVAIVAVQSARGTTSHFNVGTPIDRTLWAAMGISVLVLVIASTVFAVGLAWSPVADRAWGWALRLGMAATVVGSLLGGLMVSPTAEQQAQLALNQPPTAIGAHTVGAADGGPGLPGVGWSRNHGDLRVPHFFGLHAAQAIPLLVWLAFLALRPHHEATRLALVLLITGSYAGLVAVLTRQALAGRSLGRLDPSSLIDLGVWAGLTGLGVVIVLASERLWTKAALNLAVGA